MRETTPGEQFQSVLTQISCSDVFIRRSAIEHIAAACRANPASRCPQALSALSKQLTDEAHRALAACAASALGGVLALNADGRRRPAAGAAGEVGWSGRLFEMLPPPPLKTRERLLQGLLHPSPQGMCTCACQYHLALCIPEWRL